VIRHKDNGWCSPSVAASKRPLITGCGEPEGHANHFSSSLPVCTTLCSQAAHQPCARPGTAGWSRMRLCGTEVESWQSTGTAKTQTAGAGKLLPPVSGDPFITPATTLPRKPTSTLPRKWVCITSTVLLLT